MRDRKLVSVQEASELLSMKPKTLYCLLARGQIEGYKLGTQLRLDLDEILQKSKIGKRR